jgi:hypothetical protein
MLSEESTMRLLGGKNAILVSILVLLAVILVGLLIYFFAFAPK